jgi:translation elongation factor EF-G
MEFSHYSEVPASLAKDIIEKAQGKKKGDKDLDE